MSRRAAFWALLALTLGVYAVMALWTLPAIADAAGGLRPFDLRPGGYGLAEAQAFLQALNGEGRALYLGAQHWLDLAYPALLAGTLAWAALMLFSGRLRVLGPALALTAAVGALFDYLENARVAAMLVAGAGGITAETVAAASRATVAKSAVTTVVMLGVLFGLGLRLVRRTRARRG